MSALTAARVVNVIEVSPSLVRVTFGGDQLGRYRSSGHPDERLRLFLPDPGHDSRAVALAAVECTDRSPERSLPLARRSYTIRRRRHAPDLIDIDFAVHGSGAAMNWLHAARAGDWITMSAATGWYAPPDDARHLLIAADATGLPAVQRILADLPVGARADVILELPDPADVLDIPVGSDVGCTLLIGTGNGSGPSRIAQAVADHLPADYLWVAAEAATCAWIKKHVGSGGTSGPRRCDIRAYWRADRIR